MVIEALFGKDILLGYRESVGAFAFRDRCAPFDICFVPFFDSMVETRWSVGM